jgi:hypothetical protein
MEIQTGLLIFIFVFNFSGMLIFYLFLRRRFSKKNLSAELRSEVDKLIIDLGREADRDVALLESRILNLRALMDEADRRITLAGKESDKRQDAAQLLSSLRSEPQTNMPEKPAVKSTPITVYTRPMIQRSETWIEPAVPLHERVLDMARRGISSDMIASTMSMSQGEIELILDMNRSSL